MLWVYLLFGVIGDIFSVYVAKRFVDSGQWSWVAGIIVASIFLNIIYILALSEGQVSIVTAVWLIGVLVGGIVLGYFVFNEQISTVQWIGIVLAVISIVLLQWPAK